MEQLSIQELELLRILQKDSRFDIENLKARLNMSRSTVYDKIKKLSLVNVKYNVTITRLSC